RCLPSRARRPHHRGSRGARGDRRRLVPRARVRLMLIALLVVGGAVGAPARYLVDGVVQNRSRGVFPWGTFVINVTGSLVLGFLTGLTMYHGLGALPKVAIGTGFCGA